jgi:hypothetical protein
MQPYLFPYLGYYQLAYHTEKLVFLDDVKFIKKGFIHRNTIRLNGQPHRFTLPIMHPSQNRHINEHLFVDDVKKIINLITTAYRKAPYFSRTMPLIADIFEQTDRNVAKLAAKSILSVFEYLGLERCFLFSSEIPKNNSLKAQDRIIDICKNLGARCYTNAIGGLKLYSREVFEDANIKLEFIQIGNVTYKAPNYPYVPGLSIIDALMICSANEILDLLGNYDVI